MTNAFVWIAGILAFGTIGFWILVIAEIICLIGCMAKDRGSWATVSLVVTAVILNWLSGIPIIQWVGGHFWLALAYAAGYLVAGTVWSVIKWYSYVSDQRERYDEMKADFLKGRGIKENVVPLEIRGDWERTLGNGNLARSGCHRSRCQCVGRPLARSHKQDIVRWMSYWPFSLLWTVLFNWVVKVFNSIYQHIQTWLQNISDYKFKDTNADFTDEQPAKTADTKDTV